MLTRLTLCLALLPACTLAQPEWQTEFHVIGSDLFLEGEITSRTPGAFAAVMAQNPQVTRIIQCEMPGSADDDAMIALSYDVRARGLTTHVGAESEIASGAVDLFLAGTTRTMERGALLGVHSWSDGQRDGIDYPRSSPEHTANLGYIQTMLGSGDFYWFTLQAAPFDGIHWMSEAEVSHYGLLTQPPLANDGHDDCDRAF